MTEASKPVDATAAAQTNGHDGHPPAGEDGHGDGHGFHLPPPSWIPIAVAISFSAIMIGFTVGPWLWGLGLLLTAVGLVAWYRAARTEFEELPD